MDKTQKRILLLTGSPGIGKTTALLKVVDALRDKGYTVGGMISREVRERGTRIGFEILDLKGEIKGWLAHINQKVGPQIGKYRVNLEDLKEIGVKAILKAEKECDVVVIDEIGPMELFSNEFRQAVDKVVKGDKLVVGIVHWKAKDELIESVKNREDTEVFEVAINNRNRIHIKVVEEAERYLKLYRRPVK